jgi:16S rRNA (cytosine1402-N4)-methyltransferase
MADYHISCMPVEAAHYLNLRPGGTYVDGTVGGAGHSRMICTRIQPDGFLVGIDQDLDAIRHAQDVLAPFFPRVSLHHDTFSHLDRIIGNLGLTGVDGILLDLGLSLHQLEGSGRGFSFKREEPLDMRMNTAATITAADIVNSWDVDDLMRIFREYGEEHRARSIAKAIVKARARKPLESSKALADLIYRSMPPADARKQKIHPATRVFQALRITVNRELDRLQRTLPMAVACLNPGGRLCVLSFHSLEDRIVKQTFREMARTCTCPPRAPVCSCAGEAQVTLLTRKVVRPTAEEIAANPMARSTRLRAVEKR